ncbi:hypothetical protein NF672_15250 [Pseudomonas moraviensis]|jgi:hypothetical protein|uniref:hypothetical protein n=1 Tax=Pseudomonas moraviensis TaxID=321662 RepID=UPI002093F6AC|nr:hypothetical protein [Pseudomonas moraviensis]UST56811.1 hypothetical protein NF672_15250 [Pseudomonas moraviensis]
MQDFNQELEFTVSNLTEKNRHPDDYFTATITPPLPLTGDHFEADSIMYSAIGTNSAITGRFDGGVPNSYLAIQVVFPQDLPDGEHEVGPAGSAIRGTFVFHPTASSSSEHVRAKKGKLHIERHPNLNSINAAIEMEFEYQNETIKVSNGKVHATSDNPI